jgi:hypothetical protein
MRWILHFWNRSGQDQKVNFNNVDTYLVDEFGDRYAVIQVDNADPIKDYSEKIQKEVRVVHMFEFPLPMNNARTFKFMLVLNNPIPLISGVEFPQPLFDINLDNYAK